jgi:hypothetical protein
MAFRIHDSVVRGEIDNRVKGIVRGKIWLEGRKKPVTLELQGNACPDLAGCLLKFTNPLKRVPHHHLDSLHAVQRGTVGDITASRKVRVFDIPAEEAYMMSKRGKKPPEHMANCLYLEWFGDFNGRVVIESTDYILAVTPPEWRMSPEENLERGKLAAEGMNLFLRRLTEAIEKHKQGQKDPEEKWDEHDYEKFLKESDARTDKYTELIEKYGNSDEAQEKIAREMGWIRELTEEEVEQEQQRIEEINRACEEALNEPTPKPEAHREGIDWIRTKSGDLAHPLQHRCAESALKFWRSARKAGMEKLADKDLEEFIFEFQTTAAKLAGALNGIAEGRGFPDAAFTVAYLKRALSHLHKSQTGLEAVAPKKILPPRTVANARKELFAIREGILKLMDEFRGRKSD